jgi:GTP-binding protein
MPFTVAIVGRPNVGKSTLFNRLVGRKLAIVHDLPGITRDRREGRASLMGVDFLVVDTAGFEELGGDSIEARMRFQTDRAVEEADVALLLIDARAGVTPLDRHFADHLRKAKTPVILVANKCEGKAGAPGLYEAYGLGMGEPVPVSAEHGEGMYELFEALMPHAQKAGVVLDDEDEDEFPPFPDEAADAAAEDEAEPDPGRPLTMVIVGRPNVGKSTLGNQLLGEERLLTGPEAGLTRDAIGVEWTHAGRAVKLVDTAGLRRKANIYDAVEKLSVANTLESIRRAEVVVLVMDAAQILDKQDLTILRLIADEGRALVVAVNKWDVVENPQVALGRLRDRLETSAPQVKGVRTVTISALNGRGISQLMDAVVDSWAVWNRRIPTAQLNRWLAEVIERHPPPALPGGRRYKIRYITQVKARPPTFALFATKPDELPESYVRYLVNGLREAFDLKGVPIRLFVRGGRNPYADKGA